jgi:tetratricopeptide (TPR) repeat protein
MPTCISVLRLGAVISAILLTLAIAAPSRSGGLDLIKKGQEAEKTGNSNAALEAYTQAIQAGDLTDTQLAFAYYRRGAVHGFLGNNINGIDDFSKSIQLNPRFGYAFSLRGYLRGTIGQYDLAEKDHLAAIDLAKDQKWEDYLPWVLQHYADLWRRRGEFDKALMYCEKALQAREYAVVYFRRAWIYLDMGRTSQAKSDFEKFDQEMKKEGISYDIFWPDERGAISRLREIH